MDSFFSFLKQAREASGISLEEISDQTLINMKMLEALERGDVRSLPAAYVRAFIREYALTIGLDPAETMQRYDAWLQQSSAAPRTESTPNADATVRSEPAAAEHPSEEKDRRRMPTIWKVSLVLLALVLLDIVLWNVLEKEPMREVKELPFREVVREVEAQAARADSATMAMSGIAPALSTDSLTLVATTTDSVWLQIALDDTIMMEHYLYPKTSHQWKAKNSVTLIVIGNPTAIAFTLNNKPVQIPVRRGYVTRNVRLDRSSLQ
jgi:transcriptional regulator with XRE-family HTH domain